MPASEINVLAALKQSRYLSAVADDSLRKLLPLIRHEIYPPGTMVIAQGEQNHDVFIILKGSVTVKTDNRQLYTLGRTGDIFGEITVVTGQPAASSVAVLDELETLIFSSARLKELKEDNSHELSFLFYDWISRILADKLHLTSEKAKRFEDASAELFESLAAQKKISENLLETTAELKKSTAELEELNNLKTELIGIASHDLRSPIGSVITVMETIPTCYELDADLIELLKEVKDTCHEQLTLVNDLLDLAKIESGRLKLELTSFSYQQVLGIFKQQQKRAGLLSRNKQLTVSLQISAALEHHSAATADKVFISFDAPKVQQVLNNLIGNAIKFSPQNGTLELLLDLDGAQQFRVSVRDTGLGIPQAEQAQIFDKFHQVKQRRIGTHGETGTGLGLAICKNMVELHNGRIWVESIDGAGSTFTFTLPLLPSS